jgi:hypothetical protein
MNKLLGSVAPLALTLPTSLCAQTIPTDLMVAQQQNEGLGLSMELGTGGLIVGVLLALIYLGIWVGSIVSVVKHPFKSWIPKMIWLFCILVFELPASFAWFIFRPRPQSSSQVPPLATEPLAANAPRPEKVVMPKK